jgi:hypothetical protein
MQINCQRRSEGDRSTPMTLRITNKQRVASRGVEKTGVPSELAERAEREYDEEHTPGPAGAAPNYPDRIYRRVRLRPLLVVHLLAIQDAEPGPIAAYSISFPVTAFNDQRVAYVVNTTWLRENDMDDGPDDDQAGDDA